VYPVASNNTSVIRIPVAFSYLIT